MALYQQALHFCIEPFLSVFLCGMYVQIRQAYSALRTKTNPRAVESRLLKNSQKVKSLTISGTL